MKTSNSAHLRFFYWFIALFLIFSLAACNPNVPTFPEQELKRHIKEICLKDYGITDVEVKIVGKTLGVHLPLNKLFENDVESLMATGKVKNVETLLQLHPDAIENIQDVIFTTSRVLFSSDSNIDFYILKATDYDGTGIEFILANYVKDVKRVRFWDIPLSEYYKRSYRDMKMNRSIMLKKPILELFRNVGEMDLAEIVSRYFDSESTLKDISPFFYAILMENEFKKNIQNEVLSSKARVFKVGEILVYAKIKETYEAKPKARNHKFIYPSGTVLEYIFILKPTPSGIKISRVLPFNYAAPDGTIKKIEFPASLKLYENIETWPTDFEVEEIFLDEFLAEQATKRVQILISSDEEIRKFFEEAKVTFTYFPARKIGAGTLEKAEEAGELNFFDCELDLKPRDINLKPTDPNFIETPQVKKVLLLALKEFAIILRGYSFNKHEFLRLQIKGSDTIYEFKKSEIAQFRKKSPPLSKLLKKASK